MSTKEKAFSNLKDAVANSKKLIAELDTKLYCYSNSHLTREATIELSKQLAAFQKQTDDVNFSGFAYIQSSLQEVLNNG